MSVAQNTRGAVHVMFLIVVLAVALLFGVMWFMKNGDLEKNTKEFAKQKADIATLTAKLTFAQGCYSELAKLVPMFPPEMPMPETAGTGQFPADDAVLGASVKKVMADLVSKARAVGDTAAAPKHYTEALNVLVAAYTKQTAGLTAEGQKLKAAEEDAAKQRDINKADSDRAKADLAQSITDKDNATQRLTQQGTDFQAQRDDAQAKNRDLTAEVDKTKNEATKEKNAATLAMKTIEATVQSSNAERRIARETEVPDGKIVLADNPAKIVWIDLGGKNALRRGTVFRVYQVTKGGARKAKGHIVVTSVQADRAEARIESMDAGASGMAEGDVIYSPLFDRTHAPHFVFVGELRGRANREMAKTIIEANGGKVDEKVTVDTDFLVVGAKEQDGEEPSESANYKLAEKYGIEMILSRDLDVFLRN